ncbi:hypothetical protein RND81_12G119700 [Saponaria officinalis]|uniref:Exostosin GT47 domain-containing protein n=1 Tax=Saponaria officinalis TaxID=3572 RepID=A0AAW1H9M5_SAPOF
MLPLSGNNSPENSSKKSKSSTEYHHLIFNSVTKPRTCLIIFILTLQISILTLFHYLPQLLNYRRHNNRRDSAVASPIAAVEVPSDGCELGRFYVYDLPPELNVDIHKNCDELSPWGSRCSALSNGGFGRTSVAINGVIPAALANTWYWTDQFSSEILFHNRLLHHKCRTVEPASATAYYIPFYAGLAVGKYLWNGSSVNDRDTHCETMLRHIQQLPYLNRSKGWDHFLVMGRITWDFRRSKDEDWGSKCIYMPSMRNITRLLIERNPWDYFDVGVPYPTGFHPNSASEVLIWQEFVRTRERHSLFCFAGATRGLIPNDFRGLLLSQCRDSGGSCRVVDCAGTRCANGTSEILETFLDSEFCLQPRGDSFTRRSIFDCMIAGSIPVFFWRRSAYFQYQWFLPNEPESYSVFIHRDEVKKGTSIKTVLEKYSKEQVKRMREKVVESIPKIIYAKPNEGLVSIKDAIDTAVDGVLSRIKEQKENGYDW